MTLVNNLIIYFILYNKPSPQKVYQSEEKFQRILERRNHCFFGQMFNLYTEAPLAKPPGASMSLIYKLQYIWPGTWSIYVLNR